MAKRKTGPKTRREEPRDRHAPAPVPESTLHRAAIVVLFLLPFVFYWRYAFSNQMLFGTDWLGAGSYMWREFMAQYIRSHGNIALWWPAILSGQPTVAGFFADLFYPTTLFRLFIPVHVVWTWTFILHIFVAGLGTYLFLRELRLAVIPSALAGIAYMFSGSLMTLAYAGHDGRLMGTALMPLALFFLHRGIERRQLLQFLLCGLVVALQLFSGHLQKVYYTGLILLAYFLFQWVRAIRKERSASLAIRLAVFFGLGIGLGLALSAIQYLPVFANMPLAARGHERGYAYATSWSMPIVETFDLLTPRFSGGLHSYWGKNPFKLHSEYLGILPLLFALVAVFRCWKNRSPGTQNPKPETQNPKSDGRRQPAAAYTRFFTFTFIFSLLMAWGGETPFYYIPYHLLPGISKVRGPAMIFFVAAFSIAVLAGLGLQHALDASRETRRRFPRSMLIGALVPAGLLLVFASARGPLLSLLRSFTVAAQQKFQALETNYPAIVSGLLFAAILAGIGLALYYFVSSRRLRFEAFALACAAVMTLDIGISLSLWNEKAGYIRGAPPPEEYYRADDVVSFLRTDTTLHRVLPMHYERSEDGMLAYHRIQSVAGQLPNPLQSYQDFIGAGSSVMFQTGNLVQPNSMSLLNVKYIISYTLPEDLSQFDPPTQRTIEQLRQYFSQPWLEPVFAGLRYSVYRNLRVLPRAFLAPGYEVVATKDELLSRLARDDFNPERSVLLYEDPGIGIRDSGPGTPGGGVEIEAYDCNEIRLKARSSAPALLVLSENYHPDWKAYVDGRKTAVLRAFHTLRAVPLEPGEHDVVFRYESRSYNLGRLASLAALAFLLVVAGFTLATRKKKPQMNTDGHR